MENIFGKAKRWWKSTQLNPEWLWRYLVAAVILAGFLEGVLHYLHELNCIAFCVAIVISFLFLFVCIWFISSENFYHGFEKGGSHGIVIPIAILIFLILLSVVCFSELTYFLSDQGYVSLKPSPPRNELGALNQFYFWQFFDLIPGIKIREPLQWQVPYAYEDKIMPWLIFIFRVGIIGIVIKQFYKWNTWRKTITVNSTETNKIDKSDEAM